MDFPKYEGWTAEEKLAIIRRVLGSSKDEQDADSAEHRADRIRDAISEKSDEPFMRESLGVVAFERVNKSLCFARDDITRLMTKPRVSLSGPVRFVYVCVDLTHASNGRTSHFTLGVMCAPGHTILGMDDIDVFHPSEYENRLIAILQRIHRIPMCETASIVLNIDSATGLEGRRIENLVRERIQNVIFMKGDKLGVNEIQKHDMVNQANAVLKTDQVSIHPDFTSSSDRDTILNNFANQMCAYTRTISDGPDWRLNVTYGGGHHRLALIFQRCLHSMTRFATSLNYAKYHC
jgi:hypothetical protein